MKAVVRRLALLVTLKRVGAVAVAALFGFLLLSLTRADSSSLTVEAEYGSATTGASIVSDPGAAGGRAVRFTSERGQEQQKCAELTNIKFCDDFDGPAGAAPDSSKWRILTGSSWGGQCFRDSRENIALDGLGNLKQTLVDKKTTQCFDSLFYPSSVTSGGMDTQGKANFKYGRFEIRARLSCAKSVWGAIWTSGSSGPAWPESGEIDFYEIFNNEQNVLKNTVHAGNPYWSVSRSHTYSRPFCQDFHVYGGEWRPGYIQFMIDGQPLHRITRTIEGDGKPWPFDTYEQRLIIDLQYGSPGWPHAGDMNKLELPSSMLIDYVRVFD